MIEYDIFNHTPDFSTPPSEGSSYIGDTLAFSAAPEFTTFAQYRAERIFAMSFAWSIPRDWHAAKAFYQAKGGRAEVFLMPSWTRDFTVSSLPTLGSKTMEVNVADFGASYLTTTSMDEIGRYVFCSDFVGGLHVAKVLASEDDTTSILTLEQAFPFSPTREAIFGFALLVRFDDDETEWRSISPEKVKCRLVFRTVRERTITANEGLLTGVAQYESLPFAAFTQAWENTKVRFDSAYSLGPTNRGATQNANYSVLWAAWPSTNGVRLLKNATEDAITPPDESQGFLSSLFSSALVTDHISLSWDQNGYEVIAWHSTPGQISIRRRFGGTLRTDVFAGVSPCLYYNGTVNVQARIDGETDVVCYYIKPGMGACYARFQRDNFEIEYVVGGYPTKPLHLLKHETDDLDHVLWAVDDGFRLMKLTATYPTQPAPDPDPFVALLLQEQAGATASITDAAETVVIVVQPPILDAVGASGSLANTIHESMFPTPPVSGEGMAASAGLPNIQYEHVVAEPPSPLQEQTGGLASITNVAYELVVITSDALQEQAGADASLPELYYGP
jgi:hypothetical protein